MNDNSTSTSISTSQDDRPQPITNGHQGDSALLNKPVGHNVQRPS